MSLPDMLEKRDVVAYLLRRRLLSARAVVENALTIQETPRRNRNFIVIHGDGSGYFLKQGDRTGGVGSIAHEATMYRLLQSAAATRNAGQVLPRSIEYDSEARVLTLEYVSGARNLRQYHERLGRYPKRFGRRLGVLLGLLHRHTDAASDCVVHPAPWVLSIHRPHLGFLADTSRAGLELVKAIQAEPEYCELLDLLRRRWQARALIHHDVKLDNVLVTASGRTRKRHDLRLIDWEFAGVGDPRWDIGSVFSAYLSFWVMSIPMAADHPPQRYIHLAGFPMERTHAMLREFWRTYVNTVDMSVREARNVLLNSVRFSAARLIQTAYELSLTAQSPNTNVLSLLQLALNILRDPADSAETLLGIA
jgi:aminoglycoside phosphotransferase (APT) family kinase protein